LKTQLSLSELNEHHIWQRSGARTSEQGNRENCKLTLVTVNIRIMENDQFAMDESAMEGGSSLELSAEDENMIRKTSYQPLTRTRTPLQKKKKTTKWRPKIQAQQTTSPIQPTTKTSAKK